MRNAILSAILLCIALFARGQWVQHPSGTTTDIIYSVQMVSSAQGYWAGEYGIYKTNNGGTSWFLTSPSSMHYFVGRDMHFFDANTGVVSGTNDQSQTFQIWYTSDGGLSWSNVYTGGIGTQITGPYLSFPGADTGYAVKGYGSLLRTTDAGLTWSPVTSINAYVRRICFTSAAVGYATTPYGILKTTNKGISWTSVYAISGTTGMLDVHFTDDSTGYVSDGDGAIIKTTDAGATWVGQQTPRRHPARMTFIGRDTAFVTNEDGSLLRTTTAGLYWEQFAISSAATAYFNDVHFNNGTGVVVGDDGLLYTTGNYGGGVGKPIAAFDMLSAPCDTEMRFGSTSWSGYTRQWYFNNQPVSAATTYSHPAVYGSGSDIVSLVVSNGTYSDTFSRIITRLLTNYTPNISQVHIVHDTICAAGTIFIVFDTTSQYYNREVFVNGQLLYTLWGNISSPITRTITNVYDSTRVVVRISNPGSPCGNTPSDSLVREVYVISQGSSVVSLMDTLTCSHGIVRARIDHSSRWYGYYVYGMHDTVQGNGGTIYLTDTLQNAFGDSFAYVPVFQRGIRNCGSDLQISNKKVFIRYAHTDFSALDSIAYPHDQISLQNMSSADSYRWYFDSTASILSSTAFAPVVSYNTVGEKKIMLISDVMQHCKSDTLVRMVFVSDTIVSDTVGGICFDSDIDTSTYLNGGITSYHIDRFGNTYVGGYEFCCFAGANYSTSTAAYLRKTDKNGNLIWYKEVPAYYKNSSWYYGSYINGVTTDPNGNIYITGCFGTDAFWQFDSLITTYNLSAFPGNGTNFFTAKFDSNGREQWMISSYLQNMGNLAFGSFLGGTDIKYVDDEHIYISVLCDKVAPRTFNVQYGDSVRLQTFSHINVLQVNSRGVFRKNTQATGILTKNAFSYQNGAEPVPGIFHPTTDNIVAMRFNVVGPKLHVHSDCSISMVGFFSDSISFGNSVAIRGYGSVISAFTARMSATGEWQAAHTLYGTSLKVPEYKTLGSGSSYGDWIPRFDFDSHDNLYIATHVDSLYLRDTTIYTNLYNYHAPPLQNYYTMVAKFDPNGRNIWFTKSRNYTSNHHITGINLSSDESQLLLTGFYSDGVNLSSVHQPPVLLHTSLAQTAFIAAMDTAGDVRWINSIGSGGSLTSIFSISRSNGDLYTIGRNNGRSHQTIYNASGTCHTGDTVAVQSHCRGIYIGISAGSLPVCGHDSIDYKAFTFGDFAGATYHWQIDHQDVVANGDQIHLTSPQDGQVLRCIAILSGGDSIFSNEVILQVRPRDTLLVQASITPGYNDHICPDALGAMGAIAIVSHQYGYSPSYRWLVNGNVVSTTQSMTAVTLRVGDSIRCLASLPDDAYCILAPDTSNSIVMKAFDVDTPVITRRGDTLFCSPALWYRWYDVGRFVAPGPYLIAPHGYLALPAWPHIYTVQVSDSNGCTSFSLPDTVVILDTLATATGALMQKNVRIYPSPNDGYFIVESEMVPDGYIEIYDAFGKLVYDRQLTAIRQPVDAHQLAKGIYTVFIKGIKSNIVVKIMIE